MKKTILTLLVLGSLSIGTGAQDQPPAVMDAILSSITEINKNITGIKTDIAVINTRLTTIEGTLEKQSNRMDVLDSKVDRLTTSMTQIQTVQITNEKWLKAYGPVLLGIVATILGYFFMVLRSLKPKETHAIRSSLEPEPAGLRPKQRTKTRPAT